MARFQFKLESVLKQRQQVEDQQQRSLARLLREQFILESQFQRMEQMISGDRREMSDALVGEVPVRRIRQHASHAAQLGIRMRQFGVRLAGLTQRIDQARARLRAATTSRKAMELLKQRQHRQWQVTRRRRETRELDDLAIGAFVRAAGEHVR